MINLEISKSIFNDAYLPYLTDYESRWEVYYGGAGSGKSVFIAQKILLKCLKAYSISPRKVLIIRKTLASQKESCWRLFIDLINKWKLSGFCTIRKSEYQIELPNKSILLFKGLDDPEKIKSIVGITDIWVEEGTELTEDEFEQLNLRLRGRNTNAQIFISFNPISKTNWVYKRWFQKKKNKNYNHINNTLILKTTYKDNKFLPQEYITELERLITTNPTYYKIYALGEFCSLDKLVYTNWKVEEFNHKEIEGELLVGLDYGFINDPSAIIASILDESNKRIYIFEDWADTNKTNEDVFKIIFALGFSKSVIVADSAEPKSIEELRRFGVRRIKPSVKGPDSVIHGIQKLQQYELIVHPDCTNIRTELENYSWKRDRKTGEYLNIPEDKFNHSLDALRYSLQCVDNSKKLKVYNKSKFGL